MRTLIQICIPAALIPPDSDLEKPALKAGFVI